MLQNLEICGKETAVGNISDSPTKENMKAFSCNRKIPLRTTAL